MYDERERAFAVIVGEKIDVRTVSDTRRAAIVNWLVVDRSCLILRTDTDEQIEHLWEQEGGDASVAAVEISRALPAI